MKATKTLTRSQRDATRKYIEKKTRYVNQSEMLEGQSDSIQLYRRKTLNLLADAMYSLDSREYKAMSEQLNHAEKCLLQLIKLTVGRRL